MENVPLENSFLIVCKPQNGLDFQPGDINSSPAYRYAISLQTIHNLDKQIIQQIATGLGLTFINENEASGEVCFANERGLRPEFRQSFTPADLLDYIYAVLHSPGYSEKYEEFLKTGLAPVPYPTSADEFWDLVHLGGGLRGMDWR